MNKDTLNKIDLTLVPPAIEVEIAKVREFGVKKYKNKTSWVNVPINQYFGALLRHIHAMKDCGIYSYDPESQLMHISHAACNIAFLLALNDYGNLSTLYHRGVMHP